MPSASAVARDPEKYARYAAIALSPTENLVIDLDQPGLKSRIQLLAKALDRVEKSYQEIGASQDRISASFSHMREEHKDMFRRIGKITENNRQMKEDYHQMREDYRQMKENNRQTRENLARWRRDMDQFSAYLDLQSQKPKKIIKELKKRGKKRKLNKKSDIKQHRSHTPKSPSISPSSTQENSPSLVMRVSNLLLSPVFALFALIRRVFSEDNKKVL